MHKSKGLARRAFAASVPLLAALLLVVAPAARAAQQPGDEAERGRALELIRRGNFMAALPVLEKLSAASPNDGQLLFYLGYAVLAQTKLLKDAGARKDARLRARALMLKAREVGFDDPLLRSILESLPPGGGPDSVYSPNAEADAAMRDAEAAFVQGKTDEAFAAYQRALKNDPKLYEAALFSADMLMQKGEFDRAAEWYAEAVRINPDRETAYRYSATPLMKQRKYEEAKARYLDAVLAEPYNRMTWAGLAGWADAVGVRLSHPRIDVPTSVTPLKDNKMTITLDPAALGKDDGSAAWVAYGLTRSVWATKKFAETFPSEKAYRHSLREEAEALRMVAESAKTQQKEGKVKALEPNLARLVKLHDEGLIEAYVLFARWDEGIAQDYAEYRKANRDKLRRYLVEYVTANKR